MMRVWVIVFEHEHGVDAWPVFQPTTIEQARDQVLKETGEEPQYLDREDVHVEVRGPWVWGDA